MTTNKVWFITGGSRGLGAEIAAAALAAGDRVVATARRAETVVARFGERPDLLAVDLDVTKPGSVAAAVRAALATFGRIDVLVNNAGFGVVGAVEETSADEVRRVYETNVFGLLEVTRAVLPQLRAQRSGHIINLSSVGGLASGPGYGIYCSTKFAVEGITEALHAELAPLGIHVTAVEPGYFRTEFLDATSIVHAAARIADYDATSGRTRQASREISHHQPGDPVKLAQAMLTLVAASAPPVRLPLGTDTVSVMEQKASFVRRELDTWRGLATSTDYAATR